MPLTNYKVWAVGNPVGIGVTQSINIGLAAIAKKATSTDPYIVSNETICNQIAQILLLPCPPGSLLIHENEQYFASLNFNIGGLTLPPADPSLIVDQHVNLSWGIILFDVLCMNADRHTGNISHDQSTNDLQIFDHSHAFVGSHGNVSDTLLARVDHLSIGGHCLAREISRVDGFDMWCDRIKAIPDFFIKGVVGNACGLGIPTSSVDECANALIQRRDQIEALVKNNLNSFPMLPSGALS